MSTAFCYLDRKFCMISSEIEPKSIFGKNKLNQTAAV